MAKKLRFAFLKARWHDEIVDQAHGGFCARMAEIASEARVDAYDVPGAFELPLLAQRLAKSGIYDAIAAAALVVDCGIYRHDFVAQAVVSGLMDVQLKTEVPVLSVSLTPHNFQPSDAHVVFSLHILCRKGAKRLMLLWRSSGPIRLFPEVTPRNVETQTRAVGHPCPVLPFSRHRQLAAWEDALSWPCREETGYLITRPRVRVVVSATTRMMKIP